jgi:alcohol dehydrogenase, propanol-preferring
MIAMVLHEGSKELVEEERAVADPGDGEVLLRVSACGVCRTDLHIIDSELPEPRLPLVPGHQIIGTWRSWERGCGNLRWVTASASPGWGGAAGDVRTAPPGARTSAPGRVSPVTTVTAASPSSCSSTTVSASQFRKATRTWRRHRCSVRERSGSAPTGWSGRAFGWESTASARRLTFSRSCGGTGPGDLRLHARRRPAGPGARPRDGRRMGRAVHRSSARAPGWGHHLRAGRRTGSPRTGRGRPGELGGLRRHPHDPIPTFPYHLLWEERVLRSVANLTRADAIEFLALAPTVPVRTRVEEFPLQGR